MPDVYAEFQALSTDYYDLEVILKGGEIQEVGKEVLRRAILFSEMSALMAECNYHRTLLHH